MKSLTIRERQVRGVVIVDLEGSITLGDTNRKLHDAMKQIVTEDKKEVILNLADVQRIDSSGLGEIVAGFTTLKSIGGTLKLVNLPEYVADLMMMTKLLTVFEVFDDEREAIDSFGESERITEEIPVPYGGGVTQQYPEDFEPNLRG
jgi:anti-sigma B factor antagonist